MAWPLLSLTVSLLTLHNWTASTMTWASSPDTTSPPSPSSPGVRTPMIVRIRANDPTLVAFPPLYNKCGLIIFILCVRCSPRPSGKRHHGADSGQGPRTGVKRMMAFTQGDVLFLPSFKAKFAIVSSIILKLKV